MYKEKKNIIGLKILPSNSIKSDCFPEQIWEEKQLSISF